MGAALGPIGIALSVVSAFGQIQAGRAQAKGLAAQATMERMRAKQEALKYRQQGVDVLRRINETNASLTARAAAGSIDPFSGSAKSLQITNTALGAQEFYTANENKLITLRGGEIQAGQLRAQASAANKAGFFNAAATLGTAALAYGKLGGPPSTTLTPTYSTGYTGPFAAPIR